ncbi:MAG: prepilin peptidase [Bacteriovoracaceae bacterium]|nr:prepilin peptidase [Bacteriovoracaceae bacterium]
MMNPYLFTLIAFEILTVGIIDFRTRKISNWWHLINLILMAVLVFAIPARYQLELVHLHYPIGIFALGFLLFKIKPGGTRIMGGGDAKYLTMLYLLIPTDLHEVFTIKLLYVVLLVGSILLITSLVKSWRKVLQSICEKSLKLEGILGTKFPFAPLIMMAWIWMGIDIYIH